MKNLLLIVAVAAIVTSVFAFTTKGSRPFCLRNAAGAACHVVLNKHIDDFFGTPYLEYPLATGQWDGQAATCTDAAVANCSVHVNLGTD